MSNTSAISSEHYDGPMPFYRVLEEEFEKLHSVDKRDADATPIPYNVSWDFSESQILDPRDLARRLNAARATASDENSEDVAATVLGTDEKLERALTQYSPVGKPIDDLKVDGFTSALADRLSALLLQPALRKARSIQALTLSPYATELRNSDPGSESKAISEANRLFLEAAFPTQLERIRDIRLSRTFDRIRTSKHSALCLSGGGIRSATFALGVVQALATRSALTKFNYISTVSGGGFLGGWLSAWMKHAGPENAQRELHKSPYVKLDPEPVPVKHLRTYTNYLSPKLGLLSADTWTLAATYIRNVLLNWLVIVPLIAMAVLVPWGAISCMNSDTSEWAALGGPVNVFGFETRLLIALTYLLGLATGAYAVRFVHSDEPDARKKSNNKPLTQGKTQSAFLLKCLAPLVTSAIALTTAFYLSWRWDFGLQGRTPQNAMMFFTGFGVLLHLLGWLWAWPFRRKHFFLDFLLIVFSGGTIGALSGVIALRLVEADSKLYVAVAMPLFLLLLMLSGQIYLGVASRRSTDSDREWGARFNAWIFIVVVSWATICAIIVYGPEWFSAGYRALVGGSIGGLSGIITLMVGGSSKTNGKSSEVGSAISATKPLTKQIADVALGLAAPIFAVALVILISALDLLAVKLTCAKLDFACRSNGALTIYEAAHYVYPLTVLGLMIALVAIGYFFGYFIDTNEFSLHAM
ncbi:MAG: patatin-like phospholipase family protein, partial [Gemmatimonadaceae bacterium]